MNKRKKENITTGEETETNKMVGMRGGGRGGESGEMEGKK